MQKALAVIGILGCFTVSLVAGRLSYSSWLTYLNCATEPWDPGNSISNVLRADTMDISICIGVTFAFLAVSVFIAALMIAFHVFHNTTKPHGRVVDQHGFHEF